MPRGNRSNRLGVAAAASLLLVGCSSRYDDTSPPTGEGQERALLLLVLLVGPTLVLGGVLVWFHLRSRRNRSRDGGSPPRTVWIAVLWCLAVAFAAAWPGAIAVGLLVLAAGGPADRGDELLFLDWSLILGIGGAFSLSCVLFLGAVALALRRGGVWARWATLALAGLVSFGGLFATLLKVGDPGDAFLLPLVTTVFGPVPIPFLFWWGASDHFGSAAPSEPPPAPAAPAVGPPAAPAPASLTDRWFT